MRRSKFKSTAALETKIALLEQRSFSYQGVWKEAPASRPHRHRRGVAYCGRCWNAKARRNTSRTDPRRKPLIAMIDIGGDPADHAAIERRRAELVQLREQAIKNMRALVARGGKGLQ